MTTCRKKLHAITLCVVLLTTVIDLHIWHLGWPWLDPTCAFLQTVRIQYLESKNGIAGVEQVAKLPIERMSEYADPITRWYASNETWCMDQFDQHHKYIERRGSIPWDQLNETSYGNIAYMVLYGAPKCQLSFKALLTLMIQVTSVVEQPNDAQKWYPWREVH